jgi:hypothetical protein
MLLGGIGSIIVGAGVIYVVFSSLETVDIFPVVVFLLASLVALGQGCWLIYGAIREIRKSSQSTKSIKSKT